ncbi:hypothetical protein GGR53DRAFT_320558 [Hypoxylon sp. FL1150]|nr:hypothetical protein GGR53DRAFT_320558 [Hypoxylon sp. FL1150]
MSIRSCESVDSRGQLHLSDRRGHRVPLVSTGATHPGYDSTTPCVISPPPTPRSPPPRPNRLSLRLRSNSGLSLHTNAAALSQYTDYNKDSSVYRYSSIYNSPLDEGEVSPSLQKTMPCPAGDLSCCPFYPGSVDANSFQMALNDPVIARGFRRYCRDQGCEGDLEFLMKVREYTESTNELTLILTDISTSFITSGAAQSLSIPPLMSRTLNADVKRIAHSMLPSLEAVFHESRSHIERHMVSTLFPDFIKHQLVHCTTTALSLSPFKATSSKPEFPGLGKSFCIVDGSGSTVTAVTDAFLAVTGCPLQDSVLQQCNFLQGPHANIVLGEGRAATGLLLNSREESWNLCFVYPLRDQRGQLRWWLGAQVDISGSVKTREDLIRALDYACYPDLASDSGSHTQSEGSFRKGVTAEIESERDRSIHSRESIRSSASRSRFLQQFRKPRRTPFSTPTSDSSDYITSSAENQSTRDNTFSTQRFQPRTQIPHSPTTYAYHILLKRSPSITSTIYQRQPTPSGTRKKHMFKLHVMFYSDEAASLLSIHSDITEMDIFRVLADKSHSPSITKSFKSTIRERIACGKSSSVEILVDTDYKSDVKQKGVIGAGKSIATDWDSFRSESSARFDKKLARGLKQEKIVSHWTPLRNSDGDIELVILILTPPL